MSGECEQNTNFWCPLKSSDCEKGKLSKPCVLLYSATHARVALAQLGIAYEIEGKTMTLKMNGEARSLEQILEQKKKM
jgi:hypothetical protein